MRFLSTLLLFAVATIAPAADRPPNVVFILADDLGYGDLGCYGQKEIKTPNIDALAAGGIRFTQAYAGSTVCAPSRCCLMTGKHTGHATIRGNANKPLKADELTVAEVFKKAGYTTGLFGKWGLGEPGSVGVPTRKGFDSFFGYLNQTHAHNYYPDHLFRNEARFEMPENVVQAGVATKAVTYSPDLMLKEALGFLDGAKGKPFFLCFTSTLPHANNEAKQKGMEIPDAGIYKDKPWPEAQRNHAAMISRLDTDVGKLLAKLDAMGVREDTLVLFSSDNGPHKEGGGDPAFFRSSGPLRGIKRAMYEGGIRVPTIAAWKGRIKPAVSDQVWTFWDFLPTACELVGQPIPNGIDGLSVLPTLLGKGEQKKHDFLYWEFHEQGSKQAVRMGDWKAVRNRMDQPLELYDLSKDIGESKNVAAEHPDVIAKIEAYLKTARTESPEWPLTLPKNNPKKK